MYKLAKTIVSKIISPQQLFKHEESLRSIYSFLYTGSKHKCTVCNKGLSRFVTLKNDELLCPNCGSLSRDRRLWTLITGEFIGNGIKVLDFSPSRCLARRMREIDGIKYISTDLSGNFIADHQYDITNLAIDNDTIDLIICYHILEHITDDSKAMAELFRVLKKGGNAIIQTPFKEGDIYEDFSITSPQEREAHFGQDDHVRVYSVAGLTQRLEQAGFSADARVFGPDGFNGFKSETIVIVTK